MEKLLVYRVKGQEELKKMIAPMKIRMEELSPSDFARNVGILADGKRMPVQMPSGVGAPQESLIIFCGVNKKHFDKILFSMRQKNVQADFKAVMTSTNRNWTVRRLLLELMREKNDMPQ